MDQLLLKLQDVVNAIQNNGNSAILSMLEGYTSCYNTDSPIAKIAMLEDRVREMDFNIGRIANSLEKIVQQMESNPKD